MARPQHDRQGGSAKSVRVGKKTFPVLDRLRVRGRSYLLLERLSSSPRERFLALDPQIGPEGEFRSVYFLPRSESTVQHIMTMKRAASALDPFPLLIDFDADRDPIVMVFRWVPGINLHTYLMAVREGRRPRPTPTEAFKRIHGLAHGLSRWHRRREIVHGDIKPANILLERDSGRLVLIDFGSAWTCEKTAHRDAGDGFHPAYAAPELQTEARFVDFRSDQFSLAVIVYELMTLEIPYDGLGGKAGRAEYAADMSDRLAPPSRKNPDFKRIPALISERIDSCICRSLALNPDDRHSTPGHWLDDLDAIRALIQNPHLLAPGQSWLAQAWNWLSARGPTNKG